jgi:Ni/Fe-hydrogenase subunit HybB-like protein
VLLYTSVLVIEISPYLFERFGWEKPMGWVQQIMLPVAITGVTLSSLHQSTLGTLYLNMPHRLDPLWYTPLLPLLFFVSSVMAGLGAATLLYTVSARLKGQAAKPEIVNGLAKGAGWLTLVYGLFKLAEIGWAGELSALLAFDSMSRLMWLELGVGIGAPVALLLLPAWQANKSARLGGVSLILLGVLLNRFNATWFAQTPPQGTSVYIPSALEWLTTLGVLAGAALAWYLGLHLFMAVSKSRS